MVLGAVGLVESVLAACLLFLLVQQDTRGLRFFVNPAAMAVSGLLAAGCAGLLRPGVAGPQPGIAARLLDGISRGPTGPADPELLSRAATAALLWLVAVLPAIVRGLLQGHYATPFGRFMIVWLLAAIAPAAAGGACLAEAVVATIPPAALLAAVSLVDGSGWWAHWRRGGWRSPQRRSLRRERGRGERVGSGARQSEETTADRPGALTP
jgi:hypothetical protein